MPSDAASATQHRRRTERGSGRRAAQRAERRRRACRPQSSSTTRSLSSPSSLTLSEKASVAWPSAVVSATKGGETGKKAIAESGSEPDGGMGESPRMSLRDLRRETRCRRQRRSRRASRRQPCPRTRRQPHLSRTLGAPDSHRRRATGSAHRSTPPWTNFMNSLVMPLSKKARSVRCHRSSSLVLGRGVGRPT